MVQATGRGHSHYDNGKVRYDTELGDGENDGCDCGLVPQRGEEGHSLTEQLACNIYDSDPAK